MDIVGVMEEWARWTSQRNTKGFPASTVLGRILDGLPSTKCTLCDGYGVVKGAKFGLSGRLQCPRCHGNGKIKADHTPSKINPAFINSTDQTYRLPKIQFNFLAHKVDHVVQTGLTDKQKDVAYIEYFEPGSQYKKAKILNIRQNTYSELLTRTHKKVLMCLTAR